MTRVARPTDIGQAGNLVRATKALNFSRPFSLMVTVYVIESLADQTWYTGMAKNATNRLREQSIAYYRLIPNTQLSIYFS